MIDLEGGYILPGLWNNHSHLADLLPDPKNVLVNEPLLPAAIETAHAHGAKVVGHAAEPGAGLAVELGIDCIEHGYRLTDETIRMMAEKGTFYDPTIVCNLSAEYISEREARIAEV